jgi:hypothetical protein
VGTGGEEDAFLSGERNGEEFAGAGEFVTHGAEVVGEVVLGVGEEGVEEGLDVAVAGGEGDAAARVRTPRT